MSSRREPMTPVAGLKKPTDLPKPSARPRTLAPVPEPISDPVDVAAGSMVEPEEHRSANPAPTKPTKSRRPRPAKVAASQTADLMKPVSVSVPVALAEAWRDRAKADRSSQVDVLLDALVAHREELTALIAARRENAPATVSDGLFDRTPTAKGERFVAVSLRIRSGNLEVVNQLVDRHQAESRSQLIAAALTAYLG